MSKANRREEIRKKEEIQAKFKFSLSQADDMVTSWLAPYGGDKGSQDVSDNGKDQDPFMDLPIVPSGATLAATALDSNHKTFKDFIESKTLSNTGLNKRDSAGNNHGSKALNSLANRLRDSKRNKISKSGVRPQGTIANKKRASTPKASSGTMRDDGDSDSDDSRELLNSRSVKKGPQLLIDSKIKKKRPF